jgi:hypothetical protein
MPNILALRSCCLNLQSSESELSNFHSIIKVLRTHDTLCALLYDGELTCPNLLHRKLYTMDLVHELEHCELGDWFPTAHHHCHQ